MSPLNVIFLYVLLLIGDLCFALANSETHKSSKPVCVVQPSLTRGDVAPAIVAAFRKCGQNGKVVFTNYTYHINSVMKTTGLSSCHIGLHGTLLVRFLKTLYEVDSISIIEFSNSGASTLYTGSTILSPLGIKISQVHGSLEFQVSNSMASVTELLMGMAKCGMTL
jgi:hypothetical protein